MERQEYPGMLAHLQPNQAVKCLNDRLQYIGKLNSDVAEWLQERRRIEDQYASSLRKLAARPFTEIQASDLGIFSTPWQKLVISTEKLANAHHVLAHNIGTDVEVPLREWTSKDRGYTGMTNVVSNLAAISKELESAQKKSEKLTGKGEKADTSKVASAASEVEAAQAQWESQAPYVFEQLQAVDEARVDNLRNVLTQYQTHVIEAGSSLSGSAEDSLNALLNLQTPDEIKTFAMRTTKTMPVQRNRQSIQQSTTMSPPPTAGSSLAPIPSHTRTVDDESSHRSNSFQERPEMESKKSEKSSKGFGGGLKSKLGTVMRRRQSTNPYTQSRSPERKKSSSDVRSHFPRFGRKESHQNLETVESPPPTGRSTSDGPSESRGRIADSGPPQLDRIPSFTSHGPNGANLESVREDEHTTGLTNGAQAAPSTGLQEPLQPTPPVFEPPKDAEGFTIPPPNHDPIQQALNEAAEGSESGQPQFKVDIKSAPIQEETGDASAVMATFANALNSQVTPRRSMGTVRNRRDRNTMILPENQSIPELPQEPTLDPSTKAPPLPVAASLPVAAPLPVSPNPPLDVAATPPLQQLGSPISQSSPYKISHRNTLGLDDHASSDTHSIRSGRSLNSTVSQSIKHPEMHEPGLNSSLVETISAWFAEGKVTKANLLGEVALSFNPTDLNGPFGTEIIRLENLSANDKLAPNPAFIDAGEKPGHFIVNLGQITKTAVAFKYQVHLTPGDSSARVPLILHPAWRIDEKHADCKLAYTLNPDYPADTVNFSDLVIILHVEVPTGSTVQSCKGSNNFKFRKDSHLVYWRLGDVTLSKSSVAKPLLARFIAEGEVKPGIAEARWEVTGVLGSGIEIARLEENKGKGKAVEEEEGDPFADEGEAKESSGGGVKEVWKDVASLKRWRAGSYIAAA